MANLKFQKIVFEPSRKASKLGTKPAPTGTVLNRGVALGGAVQILHKAVEWHGSRLQRRSINEKIEAIEPNIEAAMERYEEAERACFDDVGVLLDVVINEWATPDQVTGSRASSVLDIYIGGTGRDPRRVVRRYSSQPKLLPAVGAGWRPANIYIWATRA